MPPPKTKEEALADVVDDVGRRRARLAEIELERAGGDGRAARVGVAAAEVQDSAAGLGQAARAAEHAAVGRAGPVAAGAERERITAVGEVDVAAAGKPAHVERRDRAAVGFEEQAVVALTVTVLFGAALALFNAMAPKATVVVPL